MADGTEEDLKQIAEDSLGELYRLSLQSFANTSKQQLAQMAAVANTYPSASAQSRVFRNDHTGVELVMRGVTEMTGYTEVFGPAGFAECVGFVNRADPNQSTLENDRGKAPKKGR